MLSKSLREQLNALAPDERKEVLSFLVALEIKEDKQLLAEMEQLVDDKDPKNWLTLDQLDEKLKAADNAAQ